MIAPQLETEICTYLPHLPIEQQGHVLAFVRALWDSWDEDTIVVDKATGRFLYRPALNWRTYASVLALAHYLKTELVRLSPRDMIDVQSFIWCIVPGKL